MRRLTERVREDAHGADTLTLTWERRQKTRGRVLLDSGEAAVLYLPRGETMRPGDRLRAGDGGVVEVRAAREPVSSATCDDPRLLARVCYHLGNRHVALQIGEGWLRYQRDHVLDDMVRGLSLAVTHEEAPFDPESGAYGAHSHDHGHTHDHASH
ncbi:MAG: urease accessory protein UreE [Pseudomonadota bacterium]|nr:urease accessory protein UreE [Pseudomonadota bacterium]